MAKSHLYGRTILDIDNPTKQAAKRALDRYFQTESGLILGKEYQGTCGGCGREFKAISCGFTYYFGEKFCCNCVESWKRGEK